MASLLLDEAPAILDMASKLLMPTASCCDAPSTKCRSCASESPARQRASNSRSTSTMKRRPSVLPCKAPRREESTAAASRPSPCGGRSARRQSWCARSRHCSACSQSSPRSRGLPGSSLTHCSLDEAIIARHQALGSSTSRESTESNCSRSRCRASKTPAQASHWSAWPRACPRDQVALTMPRKSSAPGPPPSCSSSATTARRAARSSVANAKCRRSSPSGRAGAALRARSSRATFRPSSPTLAADSCASPASSPPRAIRRASASRPASARPSSGCCSSAFAARAACERSKAGCA
mmetsp:Transcript_70171/g.209146  ORF Transcript_70171/g.209146 Transcript_70171/m.209146 type:complete len:295 (-) Transcript_70171:245-1129(-)